MTKPVDEMYSDYYKVSHQSITEYLKRIKIVILQHKGVNSIYGYYPLSEDSITKLMDNPRNLSLSYDVTETSNTPITDLKFYKTIKYLVKSTSRFLLKPDVGEIFDQISVEDLNKIRAIRYYSDTYQNAGDVEREHFILEADLFT